MSNILKYNQDARDALQRGINQVAEAVASTLGPKGKFVSIERMNQAPLVVRDGVTVARSITLQDPFEDQGAKLLISTAQKTNDRAGDGTTTATILAQALVNEGLKQIAAGADPQTLKKQIEDALVLVLEALKKLSVEIKTDDELEQVATISCADPVLGKIIAEAIKTVGKDGVVTIEEGNGFETTVEYKQGMEIDRGYVSPYFVTNKETVEAVLEDAYIVLTDLQISHNYEIVPFLERIMPEGAERKNLVIFGDVLDEALATLVLNCIRGNLKCCVVTPPAYAGRRIDELEDMAALTGGHVITRDSGRSIESVTIEELGRAAKVVSDRDRTIIFDGKGSQDAVDARVADLKKQLEVANTDYDKQIKQQRIAKLVGGVAVIRVGGVTETEIKERKERINDAVNAVKAAIEEGIVAGGELTLLTLAKDAGVLSQALKQPFKRLMENSGIDYADARLKMFGDEYPKGIDVMDGVSKNLIKAGIIDPAKVTRSALENAVSIASMVLTTTTLIAEERESK